MAGGIIRHSVQGTWLVEHRLGEQGPTVHLSTEAKEIRLNRIDGRSFPEALGDRGSVVAAC